MEVPLRNRLRAAHDRRSFDRRPPAPRWLIAFVATTLSAGFLMAAVAPGWIDAAPRAVVAPVYELPPIEVVASRKAELARLEREEQTAAIQQAARSKPVAKPPA